MAEAIARRSRPITAGTADMRELDSPLVTSPTAKAQTYNDHQRDNTPFTSDESRRYYVSIANEEVDQGGVYGWFSVYRTILMQSISVQFSGEGF